MVADLRRVSDTNDLTGLAQLLVIATTFVADATDTVCGYCDVAKARFRSWLYLRLKLSSTDIGCSERGCFIDRDSKFNRMDAVTT